MRNSRPARPFEPLVRFLDLPRAGSFDPTLLMALFLPLMFGVMVGDVGYGVVLLALALVARRSLAARGSALAGVTWVLAAGAAWSIVFGALFGELFGDLGTRVVRRLGAVAGPARRGRARAAAAVRRGDRRGARRPRPGARAPGSPPASASVRSCSTSSAACSSWAACSASPAGPPTSCPPAR